MFFVFFYKPCFLVTIEFITCVQFQKNFISNPSKNNTEFSVQKQQKKKKKKKPTNPIVSNSTLSQNLNPNQPKQNSDNFKPQFFRNKKSKPRQNARLEHSTASFFFVRGCPGRVAASRPLLDRQPNTEPPVHPSHAAASARRRSAPPPRERAAHDAPGAVGSGEGERGGAVGGKAERLGVLEAGFGFGYALELCVYWGRVGGVGAERGGEAGCAVEGVGCWVRGAMFVSYGVCDR